MEFSGYLMSGEQPAARIEKNCVEPLDRSRMPLYLVSGGDFETWLVGRAIDRHRPNSRILKKVLRLTDSSDTAAVLRAHAATITDCLSTYTWPRNLVWGLMEPGLHRTWPR